ncbi:MAG: type II secretion system protein GspL [Polymorphobacter sp.]|uniref:type II secretion system protein GspL n=1 Tax=Polymorphobacter sp. TaxID=1909290 RepID=UPI003A87788A
MKRLLFLTADDGAHWWQVDASGTLIRRGDGAPPADDIPVLAIPPAEAVTLRRIALPALAPAQARAAARHIAADHSAAPPESLHAAIGAAEPDGQRWLAVTSTSDMARWTSRLEQLAPEAPLVPLPLLLPAPAMLDHAGLAIVHTNDQAFAAEPDLAAALLDPLPPAISETEFARALSTTPPLDLRQGAFARSSGFGPSPVQLRRLALLAASAAALWVAGDVASWWQGARAAAAAEATRDRLAASLLPPGAPLTNARAQVEALVARQTSGLASRLAGPLMQSLASRPGVSLAALALDNSRLTATLDNPTPGDVAAIEAELRAQGLAVTASLPRTIASRPHIDLEVRQP